MKKTPKILFKNIGRFNILYIKSNPRKFMAKLAFEREYIGQKLIFTLMDISYKYGFGCSAPIFSEKEMMFSIVASIGRWEYRRTLKTLKDCLEEIAEFSRGFINQMDFSQVDVSMFDGVNFKKFYPEYLAATRDQYFNGSWEDYHNSLINEGRTIDAELVKKCIEFEARNKKDIGFVGHKLVELLLNLDKMYETSFEVN